MKAEFTLTKVTSKLIEELKSYNQWVIWKSVEGRKIPFKPGVGPASSVDSETWSCWTKVKKYKRKGFVLTESDPFVCLDLDHCLDDSRTVEANVTEIILFFESYCEISPSGKGLHIWLKSEKKFPSVRKKDFELYTDKRYITITGNWLFNFPIRESSKQLEDIKEQRANRKKKIETQ